MEALRRSLSAVIFALFQLVISAGGAGGAAHAQVVVLDEILVTAGREPVAANSVGQSHTVITGEQLQQSQTRYVADALRQVPGLEVSRTGTLGGFTQVRIRGGEGNHVLVLIDGIEVGDIGGEGSFDFGGLAVEDLERIEILRGPQSALWGSNAQTGVISIITKSGTRNSLEYGGRVEGGSDATAIVSGHVRGGRDWFDYALSAIFRRTDGFNISDFGDEKDGDENVTLNFKGSADVTPEIKLHASARYVNRETDTDAPDFSFPPTPLEGLILDTDDLTKSMEFFAGVGATISSLDGFLTHVARLELSDVTRKNFALGARISGNTGTRYHASYQATAHFDTPEFAQARHSLTGAFEYERETFRQLTPVFDASQLDEKSRAIHGLIGEYRGEFLGGLFVSAAVRHDNNQAFDDATTYALSGAYLVPHSATRLHGSVGTGVTNPTFFDQFGFIPAFFTGNPALKPEESFAWDIGVEQPFLDGLVTVDVTYFHARLEDEIATEFLGGFIRPVNLTGISRRQGVEVALAIRLFDDITVRGSYTYTDATEPGGIEEVRRPRHAGALSLNHGFAEGRGNVYTDVTYNGRMQDLEFITATPRTRVTLDSYVLVNVGGSYRLSDTTRLYGRVENLFDENYQEVFGFNTQGITGFIGIRVDLGGPKDGS